MKRIPRCLSCYGFRMIALFLLSGASATEYRVSSAADIARISRELKPGDSLVMADGTWTNQNISFKAHGTAEKPIALRAETPGKVVLVGGSSVEIDGEHLIVSGLLMRDGEFNGDAIKLLGTNCRLTECAVTGGRHKFFVHLYGVSNRMDHCYLAGKTNDSPTMEIEAESQPNHHLVDHNHFGPRPPLRRNGGETIRVGYSWQSMSNSCTTVEHNLFDRCDGELEIISNKSCENTYRFNTFLDSAGTLTLRHGNRCVVEGNFFIGHHKRGTGGIRVIGEGHQIFNNYFEGIESGAFWITAGIVNSELKGYFQARDCTIAFNTVVDCRGPCIQLDAGFGSSRRTLRPENITIANNLFAPAADGTLLKGKEGDGWKWMGNIAARGVSDREGIRVAEPKLHRTHDNLSRPDRDSIVRGAASAIPAEIKTDMDGQPRDGKLDVGADQISEAPAVNRPLTAADVGPSWRR